MMTSQKTMFAISSWNWSIYILWIYIIIKQYTDDFYIFINNWNNCILTNYNAFIELYFWTLRKSVCLSNGTCVFGQFDNFPSCDCSGSYQGVFCEASNCSTLCYPSNRDASCGGNCSCNSTYYGKSNHIVKSWLKNWCVEVQILSARK